MDYAQATVKLDNVAGDIDQATTRLDAAKAAIAAVNAALGNLPTTYAAVIAACNDNEAVSTAWAAKKASKDQLVADYQVVKARAQAMVDALS